ncbi:MAG TPA: hypothetical protein VFX03_13565 [Thermomicrobiales bacterium]|nr:hypothetical protein [Thermomicrobiales bacterium]
MRHLVDETNELVEAMSRDAREMAIGEATDCILLLAVLVDLLAPNMLPVILRSRYERNRTRSWRFDPEKGFHIHVPSDE